MAPASDSVSSPAPWRGSLFAEDFLSGPLADSQAWKALGEEELAAVEVGLREILERFPQQHQPNEATTEDELIWPVLNCLGWRDVLRQQRLSSRGREDVPDGVLFANDGAKAKALEQDEEWRRYGHGVALVEAKRWGVGLDRSSPQQRAPAGQVLRYLRRADDLTHGALRWGILSNGRCWRLYYAGARSVAEEFFEIDLPEVLRRQDRHGLKLFVLLLRPQAFAPDGNSQSLHQFILSEGRRYEERVAANLSDMVFHQVFPRLAKALAAAAEDAGRPLTAPSSLAQVREAALTLLYRFLFILYAEDRGLLPVQNPGYNNYSLRQRRDDVKRRKDGKDVFSTRFCRYWSDLQGLCQAIDKGDPSIDLPPYNGGLFNATQAPLLAQPAVRLNDQVMADLLAALSFDSKTGNYINYRDLSVEQLGSIYERLLDHELAHRDGAVTVQPNLFARKKSGSYYTPDALVRLIIKETLTPLVESRSAEDILALKICDPAMGSGHFLVSLVDYLSDRVIEAMAAAPEEEETESHGAAGLNGTPVAERIEAIRATIRENARRGGWQLEESQLDDRHIVRRLVLKRCVYGVDKNPMAVELAKVSLWLHTFTAGAPLSFLDHHLRCGDSLFGCRVGEAIEQGMDAGGLFLERPLREATQAAHAMHAIEELTDAEIEETEASAKLFAELQEATGPLTTFLSLVHALQWLDLAKKDNKKARSNFLVGLYGNPVAVAEGKESVEKKNDQHGHFALLLEQARALLSEERFFHWQVAFPGLWHDWTGENSGGFDAVIGNPPWERVKLQQVEWFGARRPEIAKAQRAADRKRMIQTLKNAGDPLAGAFTQAEQQANATARMARSCGDYPLLSGGDVNFYSLFVERAHALVKPQGMVGLLTPSGIASDKTAAGFFRGVATEGRLRALYDFENRRTRYNAPPFFPDVDSRFKFCVFVASASASSPPARCAFFLHSTAELADSRRCFTLTAEDFARVNPNTGTAPIFRSRRDAELAMGIYQRLPVLVDRSTGEEKKAWPVKYVRMFDMTNDSHLFRTKEELEEREGAFPVGGNRWDSPSGVWVPLYEGKMVQAFDHRAASVVVNPENQHRPAQPVPTTVQQHQNPGWLPDPQFWVLKNKTSFPEATCLLTFKDVTAPTNVRSMIAALIPGFGAGNTLPVVSTSMWDEQTAVGVEALLANLNAIPFDYVARQKIQGQHLNWFILEQLPVIPPDHYTTTRFGPKTAAEIVQAAVLELTYTAHDMAPFARDMGHVDAAGEVLPPFPWDEAHRLHLRAKLDALYFHLYGITNWDDVRYIYSTFPIVERQEQDAYGCYRSLELCLAYMNALAAGQPDVVVEG
ncbi:MAG: N-6 DNA methylase [Synechococcus sp. SB0662_bin_14]|nr:N-6 DNA methylase [Synechococcus sp. SB0668_bin_13]MYC48906.1 N-6 DNA methylase [Synechococcus sp. SB0662_bin_14]